MEFLNKETENLLKECVDNSSRFPGVLAEKFEGLSAAEDMRLRGRIKVLVDQGYFSNLQWADDVPWFGTITEKGYDYFHDKEVFIRSKLRKQPNFKLLDEESETALLELVNNGQDQIIVRGDSKKARILEHLEKQGYISFGKDGLSRMLDGSCAGVVSATQSGKNYFSDKEELIEEILLTDSTSAELPKRTAEPTTQKTRSQEVYQDVSSEGRITFSGILGFDCGEVEPYSGPDKQRQDKGYIVRNGIPTLRGFARISDLEKASKAKYEEYQRDKNQKHVDEIAVFFEIVQG